MVEIKGRYSVIPFSRDVNVACKQKSLNSVNLKKKDLPNFTCLLLFHEYSITIPIYVKITRKERKRREQSDFLVDIQIMYNNCANILK